MRYAGIAQLVEQLICNQQVGGSSPSTGSKRRVISLFERKQKTQELLTQITKIEEKYEDKIASQVVAAIRKSLNSEKDKIDEIWNKAEERIIDLIYKMLEEIYALIIKFIKECYPEADTSKKLDIKSLTWQEDGKTIEQRVKVYCDYASEVLKVDTDEAALRDSLIHNFIRIIETEDITIFNQILVRRVAKKYPYAEISNGSCECCDGTSGIKLVTDISKWPPFHPFCACVVILYTQEEYEKLRLRE